MRQLMRFSCLALLAAGLTAPGAFAGKTANAEAAKAQQGVMRVDDKASAFTADGISAAEAKFDGVTFKARTHLTVATRNSVADSKKADLDATQGNKAKASAFFSDWAHDLAKTRSESGVFVLVYTSGDKFFVKAITDKASDLHRHFTDKEATELEEKLITAFRAAKGKTGDEAKKIRDGGLLDATNFVVSQLEDTSLPTATGKVASDEHKSTGGMSIMGWVCIAAAVLLVIWVIIALIRMMTGSVNGYGGGYGGGGGGGGGMGFMGGMMGGMFGAMAGMYLYDSMTGGHHYNDNYGSGNENSGGSNDASGDTGDGNFDGGSEGQGGGDWGDSGGTSDTGGGGDWGGGGDTGGGGDMGGGGDW